MRQPDPKRGLIIKLCEIMGAVGYVQKRGQNETQRYKYATEADIAEMVRGEFSKRNIFVFPNVVKNERVRLVRSKQYKDVIEEKVTYATDLEVEWTFVDGDTGQERSVKIPGCSESPGDKGVYVAMTGSEKYLIMKSFFIPTGDDPENDNNETDGKGSREAAQAKGKEKVETLKAQLEASLKEASLFFIWFPESNTAEITGHRGLMKSQEDLLKPLKQGGKLIANLEQLEALKVRFEERGVSFQPLRPM